MGTKRICMRLVSRLANALRLAGLAGHHANIRRARRALRRVRAFDGDGRDARCIAYLRAVEPAVFEELVLSALEDAGNPVLRNRRYTGYGGVDGCVWLAGAGWCAVQSKRYAGHIDHEHVRAFAGVVRAGRYGAGLFVHTGRSGAAVYGHLRGAQVLLLSGARLLRLVLDGELEAGPSGMARTGRAP